MKRSTSVWMFSVLALALLVSGLLLLPESVRAQGSTGYVTTGYGYSISGINLLNRTLFFFASTNYPAYYGALNQRGTKLWVALSDQLAVYSTATAGILYQSAYGSGTSRPVFSPDGSRALYLRGGYPTVLISRDTATYARIDSFSISGSSYWTAPPVLSADGNKLYFTDYSTLFEVDSYYGTVLRGVALQQSVSRLKVSRDGKSLYALGSYGVMVINLASLTTTSTLSSQYGSSAMELNRDGSRLYLVNSSNYSVRVFDLPGGAFADHSLNYPGIDVALAPSDSLLYIGHNVSGSDNISIYNVRTDTTISTLTVNYFPASIILPPPLDIIRPAPITDLQVVARSFNTARLIFTSPGDDSVSGRATFYSIRYDTVPITDANFAAATKFLRSPVPRPAGELDTIDVTGLRASTTYYVAIKAGDEVLNTGALATGSVALPPPPKITLQPYSFSNTMGDNDSLLLSFTLGNTGGSNLEYSISLQALSREQSAPSIAETAIPKSVEPSNVRNASNHSCPSRGEHQFIETRPLSQQTADGPSSVSPSPGFTVQSGGPKVLLLQSEIPLYLSDVRTKLLNTGRFSLVDTFDFRFNVPTLAKLKTYDAVLVWADYYLSNPNGAGDALADFVDAGGGVVTAVFSMVFNSSTSAPSLAGRFTSGNYWAIQPGNQSSSHDNLTLGTVQLPNNPVMSGVTTFVGNHSYRVLSGTTSPGATRIASWSDGSVLVAEKDINGIKRVDLNFFPPSSDVQPGEFWESSSDGIKMIANALGYVAGGTEKVKVAFSPASGVVSPGGQQTIQMTIKTQDARAGNYTASIGIASNDPDSATVMLSGSLVINDLTPPHVVLRFFQNEELTQYVNVIGVAGESLYTPSLSVVAGQDSSAPGLTLIDTANFVYKADYKMSHGGTLTATLTADDSVGNRTVISRQLSVQPVLAGRTVTLSSADNRAQLDIAQGTFEDDLYLTCQSEPVEAAPAGTTNSIGDAYTFSPASKRLGKVASIVLRFPGQGIDPANAQHLGIYRLSVDGAWTYLPTRVDLAHRTLHAAVDKLGTYQVFFNPALVAGIYTPEIPASYELRQNFPNPFNPTTEIHYDLPENVHVRLIVYNVLGEEIATLIDESEQAGFKMATFQADNIPSGVYFYRLQAGTFTDVKKMILIR